MNPPDDRRMQWWGWLGLVGVLLLAGWLRLSFVAWDGLQHAHPDERYILSVATSIDPPPGWTWREGIGPLLDAETGGFNPFYWPPDKRTVGIRIALDDDRSFAYGHWPLYAIALTGKALLWLGDQWPALGAVHPLLGDLLNTAARIEFYHLTVVGRVLSALMDTATVALAFLLGRRLFGTLAGLLGASAYALAVLAIQLAHFATFDVALTMCVTGLLWLAVRYAQDRRALDLALAGAVGALAVGSKFSAVMLGLAGLAALLLPVVGSVAAGPGRWRRTVGALLRWQVWWPGLLALVVGAIVFLATNPFALLAFEQYADNISRQGAMVRGVLDWRFVQQYRDTTPVFYSIGQQGQWALGWPLTLLAYGGLGWGVWRAWYNRDAGIAVALAWLLPYLAVTFSFVVKFPRYLLPSLPGLLVLGGGLLAAVMARRRWAGIGLAAAVMLPTVLWAMMWMNLYRLPHPYVLASDWVYAHVPADSTVVIEDWDEVLPLNRIGRPLERQETYTVVRVDTAERPDDAAKLDGMLAALAEGDVLILASARHYGVLPRFERQFPLATAYYQALMAEDLGYELVGVYRREMNLANWVWYHDPYPAGLTPPALDADRPANWLNGGFADESLVVYDHPLVLVWWNADRLDVATMQARVAGYVGR